MTKAEFLSIAEARYDALHKLNADELSFYAYEEQFTQLWTELGREVLESNLGPVSASGRKKSAAKRATD
jgi:hypothetical protein